MRSKTLMTTAFAAALVTMLAAAPAGAQGTSDSRTEFTFNQPVEMPGITLPPGTYIFRFANPTTGGSVMQVQAKDASNKNYGMFMTIAAQRPRPSDDAELRFLETPAGKPAAVKTWWYPGNTIGREFIYPRSQARRLAQATNQVVLATKAETVPTEVKGPDLSYVSASGQETPLTDEQLVAVAANTPPVGVPFTGSNTGAASSSTGARAQTTQAAGASTRTRLPKTSSPLPLVGLLGLVSLLGAAGIRFRR